MERLDKYERMEPRSGRYYGGGYYNSRYDKYDINFRLPLINPVQNNQIKNNLTYPNKVAPKMTLPNYLKAQYNFLPSNTLNYKPAVASQQVSNSSKAVRGKESGSTVANVRVLGFGVRKSWGKSGVAL